MAETILRRYRLDPQGNPLAGWSAICGIAGFCVPYVGGSLAIIFGVAGLVRARKTLTGQGAAVTGILLGILSLLIYALLWTAIHGIWSAARSG